MQLHCQFRFMMLSMLRFLIVLVGLSVAMFSSCQPSDNFSPEVRCQVYTPPEAFGAQAWKKYFAVDVGEEPPLPSNIEEILNKKATFLLEGESDHQRVRDNHLLTLIPVRVAGQAFTLDTLGELVLRYFPENNRSDLGRNAYGYRYYGKYLTQQNRTEPLSTEAYWLLLPKTVLSNSRSETFSAQEAMVAACSGGSYRIPRALEVATSLLSHYARSQERLYVNAPRTYTRCSDQDENTHTLAVGGFDSVGLGISSYFYLGVRPDLGISCCRKF